MSGCMRSNGKEGASGVRRFDTCGVWYAALVVYLAALSVLSLNPWLRPVSRADLFSPDKIDHALAYGGLSILLYFCLSRSRRERVPSDLSIWGAAIGVAVLVGVLLEVCQSLFTRNRAGSVVDAIANAIGALVGYAFFQAAAWGYRRTTRRTA